MKETIFGTKFVCEMPRYCDGREKMIAYKDTLIIVHPDHQPRMLNRKTKRFVIVKGTKRGQLA